MACRSGSASHRRSCWWRWGRGAACAGFDQQGNHDPILPPLCPCGTITRSTAYCSLAARTSSGHHMRAWRLRHYLSCVLALAIVAKALIALVPLHTPQPGASFVVDTVLGPMAICRPGVAGSEKDPSPGDAPIRSDHCPACLLAGVFVLAVALLSVSTPLARPQPIAWAWSITGIQPVHLLSGRARSRAPPQALPA